MLGYRETVTLIAITPGDGVNFLEVKKDRDCQLFLSFLQLLSPVILGMLTIETVNRIIHKRKEQNLGSVCLILLTSHLKILKQKKSPKGFLYITVTFSHADIAGSYQTNVDTAAASISWAHHRDKATKCFYE